MTDEKAYYLVPIFAEEKDQIRQANIKEKRKQVIADVFNSKRPRPSETPFFIFLIRETILSKEFLFGFVIQFSSSGDRTRQRVTAWASFAFQNDGTEMFVSFRNKIKNKKNKIPKIEADRLLVAGLKERYDTIWKHISEALTMVFQSLKVKTPIQIEQDKKTVESYTHDLKKPIHAKDSKLEQQIVKARKQLLQKYVSKPSLPLDNVSKKNRSVIAQMRREHQKQLLETYGKLFKKIPQQVDPLYRQKIMEHRRKQQQKRQQQQRQTMGQQDILHKMKPYQQQIQQSIRQYGQNPEMLVEKVLWRQLGLIDPVTHQRVVEPVILPSSKTIVEKDTLQTINIDPISRVPLPQNRKILPVSSTLSDTIQSIQKTTGSILKSSLPLNVKVFKLIQLREKQRNSIDQQRLK